MTRQPIVGIGVMHSIWRVPVLGSRVHPRIFGNPKPCASVVLGVVGVVAVVPMSHSLAILSWHLSQSMSKPRLGASWQILSNEQARQA